ncbi:hypothetical protein [Actibacterium sp. 188UL27-1]|uniref:hypothetical protein n=1 Tax=Actibacterium sp. 188UL27-1 TaxID=2786961 RepID=UPI001956FD69|nr:hypothetical protein [Actibacterium sp. 188UL27-1]MBM7069706.1 hypothetical protein [Actibacterium sp. 188UL27-1]
MTQIDCSAKSDLDGSIIAQLMECSLHARYSKDAKGGRWARAQIREELLKRGGTLPPYTYAKEVNDNADVL